MATRPSLLVRVRALCDALVESIRRAAADGRSWWQMALAAMRAIRAGPRVFARRVISYAAQEGHEPAKPIPSREEEYLAWLANEPIARQPRSGMGRVSVIMPTYNTSEDFLRAAFESLLRQDYIDWELCIHDDASDHAHVRPFLVRLAKDSERVRISFGERREGIAAATNAALSLASGRWVAFLDHDDVLHPNALSACVEALSVSDSTIVYTDHDALAEDGRRCLPYFKPDWNPDLFLAQMYLGHLVMVERELVQDVGGLRSEMDGAQDYDLVLRCIAQGARVAHVPRVLYHWRQHAGSTAANADAKPYAHHAGRRALQNYVINHSPGAIVQDGLHAFCYDVRYPVTEYGAGPMATIIIPTRDRIDLLSTCVRTLVDNTDSPSFELIIVDNGSHDKATLAWLAECTSDPRFRVLRADMEFNWSALNNLAARDARGRVLIFLNNDTEIVTSDWLRRLVENAVREEVGACGPLLLYPDETIQHAGVVVGMGGWADHVFKGLPAIHKQHLFASPVLRRNVLAVTGACLAIERSKFEQLGGFDESFVVCGSDVDLCLRAHQAGMLNVYVPEARLIHHESKTRDPRQIPDSDFVRSAEAYAPYRTEGDPFYSRNLDPMSPVPALRSIF